MVKLGHEEPVISMDTTGKIVLAKNFEILGAHLKMLHDVPPADGERILIATKEMGACEIYPQTMAHSPNGRLLVCVFPLLISSFILWFSVFVVMASTLFTPLCHLKIKALAKLLSSFGPMIRGAMPLEKALLASNVCSCLYGHDLVTFCCAVFKNFKEAKQFRPPFAAEGIFGGALVGIRSNEFVDFYDWDDLRLVRRIGSLEL